MSESNNISSLTSRIITTKNVVWRELKFLQQDDFKELADLDRQKLKNSLVGNQFIQAFYVWEDSNGDRYCLDGKHRTLLLEDLIKDGVDVPELLPGTFISCKDKKEASKLVLVFSSAYAKVTQQGLHDFITLNDLDWTDLKEEVSIPAFSVERFEQKFDLFDVTSGTDEDPDFGIAQIEVKVQAGDLFQLGRHRIICGSFQDPVIVQQLMVGDVARIVICDPPYNLPTNFFLKDNRHTHNHADFAMGAGEMTDDEFSAFLALIMQLSVDVTVPGAIHYIFMDWRHVWHMMDAAKKVYGNCQPKQLCVWNKDIMANGSFYRAKQELCFIFSNEAAKAIWNNDMLDEGGFYKTNDELCFIFKNGDVKHLSNLELKDRIRSNVWNYPSAVSTANPDRKELKDHPTPKPVQMIADAILDTTRDGDIVADWFLGSGTCLIACEKTNRACRATEIEPKYIQHIINRYVRWCKKNNVPIDFQHINGSLQLEDILEPTI